MEKQKRPKSRTKARLKTRPSRRVDAPTPEMAGRLLRRLIRKAQSFSGLTKLEPLLALCKPATAVEVALVDRAQMTRLNTQYRGKKRATDVLSFEAPAIFKEQGRLGELVICLPVLLEQAAEFKHSPKVELEILLAHGLLHLLGLDHERSQAEAKKQKLWERKLISTAGLLARAGIG